MKKRLLLIAPIAMLVVSLSLMLTTGFNSKPDVHLWNWFGYEFGLDFSSRMPFLRIGLVLAGIAAWIWMIRRDDSKKQMQEQEVK